MKSAIQRGAANRSEHDPRTAALRIIDGVLTGNDPSQALLDTALRESHMVPTDKGLCTELVYGYLRTAIRLQWNLRRLLKNPDKLPAEMMLILGLAAYELACLRIPAHASVNWAVSRVKNRFGQGLAGVANGVLRAFAREVDTYDDEAGYAAIEDRADRLSVIHALPVWIVRLWLDAYGEDKALALMRGSSARAVAAVRVNGLAESAETVRETLLAEGKGVPVADRGVAFPEGAPYMVRLLEKKGAVSFQSAGVQALMEALAMPTWPGPLWDACAGSGGKTAAMLEQGLEVRLATDLSQARITRLAGELKRLGLERAGVPALLVADAANLDMDSGRQFATILVDAPCSGLGTLSRRPEIRYRRSEESIAALTAAQDALLGSAAQRLCPDGRIVYLTCTMNPAENDLRVRAFLARHEDFSLDQAWETPHDSPWHEYFYGAILSRRGS